MDLMAIQFECPGHVSSQIRAGLLESAPMNAAVLMLYAAHRLLRTACEACGDYDMAAPGAGRFADLIDEVLRYGEVSGGKPIARHMTGAVKAAGVSESLKRLKELAASLMVPDALASRTSKEWQTAVDQISDVLGGLVPLASALRPAAVDDRGYLHVYAGPCGAAVCRMSGAVAGQTVLVLPGGAFSVFGPAFRLQGRAPEPLIPWPGRQDSFETIDGLMVDHSGNPVAPLAEVDAAGALGRLMAWHLGDSWDTAARLSRIAPGDAAAEFLVLKTLGTEEWASPSSIQRIYDFVTTNGSGRTLQRFHEFAVQPLREMENRVAQDFGALAELLIVRQQFESGTGQAQTLRRLSGIYSGRLGDRTAAQLCMVKALEAAPGDQEILAGLMELTADVDANDNALMQGLADVAAELSKAAEKMQGRDGQIDVLRMAAHLFEKVGDAAAAEAAHSRILDVDPNAVESFNFVARRLAGPSEVEKECRRRLRTAWKSEARGRYLLVLSDALRITGHIEEAAAALKEATTFVDETVELMDKAVETLTLAEDWPAAIGALKRRAELSDDPESQTAAAVAMADIALEKMNSPVIALASLQKFASGRDPEIARRMFQIHSQLGMWADAAVDLGTVVESTNSPDDWAALARINRDRLGRTADAAAAFRRALDRMEGRTLVSTALEYADLPGLDDSDGFVATILNRAIDATDDDIVKAGIFKRLGGFDPSAGSASQGSMLHLEEALRLNPVDADCAIKLAEIYLSSDMAEKAVSVLEAPAKDAGQKGDVVLEKKLRSMAAAAAARCFDHKGAARHLKRILAIRPDDIDSSRKLARAEAAMGNVDEAIRILESVTAGSASPEDAPLLRELGRALAARGDSAAALLRLQEAWQLDSTPSEEIFRELAETASAAGDRDAMIAWLKRLVHIEGKSPQKFTDLIRLGDAIRAGGDLDGAIEWYMTASREDYSRKVALHKALEVSIEAGHFAKSRNLLMSITEEEQDDLKKSDYLLAAALLARDNMNDDEQAASILKEALVRNPFNEPAADALDEILLKHGRLEDLAETLQLRARHYRVSGDSPKLQETLRKLADVYETNLHNSARAAEVFKQILTITPDDLASQKHLAYCLTRMPGSEVEALDTLRRVVAADPTSLDSYRAIRDLSILTNDHDLATRASSALVVLGQADESDFHLAARNRSAALRLKRDQIPSDAFLRWIAKGLDTQVARIFALLYVPILKIVPFKTPADLGLGPNDRIGLDEDGLFQNMADAVGRVFDMELPAFWYAKGTVGIRKAPFAGKALLVGDDLIATRRGKDLRFSLARAVVSFMPGAELCGVVDAPSLRLFFLAALKMSFTDYPLPQDAQGAADFVQHLSRLLKDQEKDEIRRILGNFRKLQRPVDLPVFTRSVDRIAARAGLFMSNDLEVAAGRTMQGDLTISDMEPEDRLIELCSWCVSSDFSELKNLMIQS